MNTGRPKRLSIKERKELIDLYRSGLTYVEIARVKTTYRQFIRTNIINEATPEDHAEHSRKKAMNKYGEQNNSVEEKTLQEAQTIDDPDDDEDGRESYLNNIKSYTTK